MTCCQWYLSDSHVMGMYSELSQTKFVVILSFDRHTGNASIIFLQLEISPQAYLENPKLSNFFKVLSLSLDKSGVAYVSTMEARKYPIIAIQWHPGKWIALANNAI